MNHSLNLILQEVAASNYLISSALSIVQSIHNFIRNSPKRSDKFKTIQKISSSELFYGATLKPICPTRWTARTAAIDAVINNYECIMETLDDIFTEGGKSADVSKAPALILLMQQFDTFLGLNISKMVFSGSEQVAIGLQSKNINAQDACTQIDILRSHLQSLRNEDNFQIIFKLTK